MGRARGSNEILRDSEKKAAREIRAFFGALIIRRIAPLFLCVNSIDDSTAACARAL